MVRVVASLGTAVPGGVDAARSRPVQRYRRGPDESPALLDMSPLQITARLWRFDVEQAVTLLESDY